MEQNCEECAMIDTAKKEVAQHIIDIYHTNANHGALSILGKIITYCKSV